MISPFWLLYAAGRYQLSPIFAQRDVDDELGQWLRLSESDRADQVQAYAHRRPPTDMERRNQRYDGRSE